MAGSNSPSRYRGNGDGLSTVDLHPGGIYEHLILTKNFCSGKSDSQCPASAAGLYDIDSSQNVVPNVATYGGFVKEWGSESAEAQ